MSSTGEYRAAAGPARAELREKGSRFLGIVEPASDQKLARARIEACRREYPQARHVCWAWRIGAPPREGRSDAGEPAGTAGTPILQVLKGAELSDVLAIVVRWFGGVKLGKGGLARAYSGVVKLALEDLPVVTCRPVARLWVELPYERLGDLRRLLRPPEIEMIDEKYGERIEILLQIERSRLAALEEKLGHFATHVEPAGN